MSRVASLRFCSITLHEFCANRKSTLGSAQVVDLIDYCSLVLSVVTKTMIEATRVNAKIGNGVPGR